MEYAKENATDIEAAYLLFQERGSTAAIHNTTIAGKALTISFAKMNQTNDATGWRRQIHRAGHIIIDDADDDEVCKYDTIDCVENAMQVRAVRAVSLTLFLRGLLVGCECGQGRESSPKKMKTAPAAAAALPPSGPGPGGTQPAAPPRLSYSR